MLPEAFKAEVCKGHDPKAVVRALRKAGWIDPGEGGRPMPKPRLPGLGLTRCYVFNGRMWSTEEN